MAPPNNTIIFIGKLPPPFIGPAIAAQIILRSQLRHRFQLIHLDASDQRDINTLGAYDFRNFYIAVRNYIKLVYYVLKFKPAIVYTPISQSTIGYLKDSIFIIIAKLFRRKVVAHLRGGYLKTWYDQSHHLVKRYFAFVHSKVDAQIVLGNNLRSIFNWFLPEDKIFTIPNGANFEFPPSSRRAGAPIRILFLANFIPSKGVLETLHATAYLDDFKNDLEFVFAGSWRDDVTKIRFYEEANHSSIPIQVHSPVEGKEKWQLYADADIFVLPTYYPYEGHPWVIVEAMAAGLPIIATDQGALMESVIDGINGFLIEPRNSQQIAEKIKYLIEHPEVRVKMGQASRRRYLQKFTEERMVEALDRVFTMVLAKAQ